jgi:methylenetetrahydrofolate reductase (NADPH)
MALRGDIPIGMENMPRDYKYAIELVRELRESGDFCIGGACYPEGHPESESLMSDIFHLKEKMDAGVDFVTTQMFFDFGLFSSFLDRASAADINVSRIVPGIMPITSVTQVERVVKLSGCHLPKSFLDMVDKHGACSESMRLAGIDYAIDQILTLYQNGFKNVHVYSMNKPDVAKIIFDNVSDILVKNGKNSLHK